MFTIKHIVTICLKHAASAQLTKTLQNSYLLKNGSVWNHLVDCILLPMEVYRDLCENCCDVLNEKITMRTVDI